MVEVSGSICRSMKIMRRFSRLNNRSARPEYGVNAEFAHFVNEHHKVMTKNFAERFVNHRHVGFAAERISKFPLHHGERGFNVAPLMVVLQELLLAKVEVVVHLRPRSSTKSLVSFLHRDERSSSELGNDFHVVFARVSLVSGNLTHSKVLHGSCCQ